MTVTELANICQEIAPPDCVWIEDNIGLIVGDPDAQVTRALIALDVSMDVINEAHEYGAQAIISHHPVIFKPFLSRITNSDPSGRRVMSLIKHDISSITMHTNYDGAPDGVNDELARRVGIANPHILVNSDGNYGRFGHIEKPMALVDFAAVIKHALNTACMRVHNAGRPVHKVCVGSGGSGKILPYAVAEGCDTFVTGDVRHDVFCDARDIGINLIDAGHFATENIMCDILISALTRRAPELDLRKAEHSLAPYEAF